MQKILRILLVFFFTCVCTEAVAANTQITSVTSNLVANPNPGDSIRLTVHAVGPEGANSVHQFYYTGGYGTEQFDSNSWEVALEWGIDDEAEYTFPSTGNNYLVGKVVSEGETWQFGDAQGGFNVFRVFFPSRFRSLAVPGGDIGIATPG